MTPTKRALYAVAALALIAGSALYAAPESAPAGKLTVTYFYLPG